MSQINKIRISVLLVLAGFLLLLTACGSSTPNPKASFDTTSQQHAAGWLPAGHAVAAQADQNSCAECHGSDFQGGISRVSCSRCHLGGPASKHPADWAQEQIWSKHALYAGSVGSEACANAACHGADLEGVAASGPSCTTCHLGGAASLHPTDWGKQAAALHPDYTLNNGDAKCANAACHGSNLGGAAGSGPACTICHASPGSGVSQAHGVTDHTTPCADCHGRGTTSKMFHRWEAPTPVNHAAYVTNNGTGTCAIAACHGTTLSGGQNCPSCTSCHLGGTTSHHPLEWGVAIITAHQNYVGANTTKGCANAACHGTDLLAGPGATGPSCTSCHIGGVVTKHPVDFGGTPALTHNTYVATNGTLDCAVAACHGANLNGGIAGPSCSSCHLGGPASKHPASFGTTFTSVDLNHNTYIANNGSEGCKNGYCHGATMTGVTGSGPACSTAACHQRGYPVLGNAPTLTNCASCHDKPPTGAAAPNRAGAHAKHNALAGVTNVCNTCHSGAGTGTTNHFNGTVDVQFLSAYNAKSGTATRNVNGTCSEVRCHGGQTTPSWLTGTINVNTPCILCHISGATEYNGFVSGLHNFHVNLAIACTTCHVAAQLPASSHFSSLATTTIDRSAAIASLNSSLSYTNYSISGNTYGNCTPGCHVQRNW